MLFSSSATGLRACPRNGVGRQPSEKSPGHAPCESLLTKGDSGGSMLSQRGNVHPPFTDSTRAPPSFRKGGTEISRHFQARQKLRVASHLYRRHLPWSGSASRSMQSALGKINLLLAPLANMRLIKLIRENLFLHAAFWAFAGERRQSLEILIPWAVQWCRHKYPPLV
jgi:hypothetical protein